MRPEPEAETAARCVPQHRKTISSKPMVHTSLSHSQSLRVIGQRLQGSGVTAFEVTREAGEYLVNIHPDSFVDKRSRRKIPGLATSGTITGDYARAASLSIKFTAGEILTDNAAAKSKRVKPHALPDIAHLSVILRVLGDYLDRNAVENFAVLWSGHSAKVRWRGYEQSFTPQNLYDLGILMHLRSTRYAAAKSLPREAS